MFSYNASPSPEWLGRHHWVRGSSLSLIPVRNLEVLQNIKSECTAHWIKGWSYDKKMILPSGLTCLLNQIKLFSSMVLNMPNLGSKISFMSKRKNSWNDKKSNQESLMITSQGGRSTLLSSHDNRIVTALFNYNNLCDLFVVSDTRIQTRNPKSRQLTFLTPPASTACSLWKTTWKLTQTRLFNKQAKEAIIDIALFLFGNAYMKLFLVVNCC